MQPIVWTFLWLWSILLTTRAEDIRRVTCFFSRDCVLPCESTHHQLIQWHKAGNKNPVHTFEKNVDLLENQDTAFRGRTSLFTDQISQGNVSLLLRRVRVEDEGIYTCYTSSGSDNLERIIRMDVKAPIERVDIKFTDKGITCNTSNVYPKPIISWSSNLRLQRNFTTETQTDEQGLISLTSNTLENEEEINTTYNCTISFEDKSQNYTASLRREKIGVYSGQDAIIHCPFSRGEARNDTITLRFKESSTILKTQATNITTLWEGIQVHLARDRNVTLYRLDMKTHGGNYTCETFTTMSITEVVQTSLLIISDIHYMGIAEAFAAAVVVVSIVLFIVCYLCYKHDQKKRNPETEPLSGENHVNNTHALNGNVQLDRISKAHGENSTSGD